MIRSWPPPEIISGQRSLGSASLRVMRWISRPISASFIPYSAASSLRRPDSVTFQYTSAENGGLTAATALMRESCAAIRMAM